MLSEKVNTMSGTPGVEPITGRTCVVGVIGWPVAHSLSPAMHNAAFAALGLPWVYVPFAVPPGGVATALAGLRALGLRGVNVTIPHKQAAAAAVERMTLEAEALGSVNTVFVAKDNALVGHSTDGAGFLRALREEECEPAGKRVTVVGAGGAARAIVSALLGAGAASVSVIARDPAHAMWVKAQERASLLPWESLTESVAMTDLLVNATPLGMAGHAEGETVVPATALQAGQWVCDLVYTPRRTRLLQEAEAQGCHTIEGLGMLVHQGAEAFTLWTGLPAPVVVMRNALLAALAT
jgi:shikimate dehydrogenase